MYRFAVYQMGDALMPFGGVYAVTLRQKDRDGYYSHQILYVGQAGDLSTLFDTHNKLECFKRHKAKCVCVRLDEDEESRLRVESDLIQQQNPPCNQ
jgi:hypothetical protein